MSVKFVVVTMVLKAGVTFGSMARVMTVVFYRVSFFASKAVIVRVEEPGKFGYDVEMPIVHQQHDLFWSFRSFVNDRMAMFGRYDDELVVAQYDFEEFYLV